MKEKKFRAWDEKRKKMWQGDSLWFRYGIAYWKEKLLGALIQLDYIGLKDKNGVDIYEGDVVQWSNNRIVQIYWNDVATPHWSGLPDTKIGGNRDCEIIGNIYENPELLDNNK